MAVRAFAVVRPYTAATATVRGGLRAALAQLGSQQARVPGTSVLGFRFFWLFSV